MAFCWKLINKDLVLHFFHQWHQCANNAHVPQPWDLKKSEFNLRSEGDNKEAEVSNGCFQRPFSAKSAKGLRIKAFVQCVRVIANRRRTNKQAVKKHLCEAWHQDCEFGNRRTDSKPQGSGDDTFCESGFFLGKDCLRMRSKVTDIPLNRCQTTHKGPGGRGLTINRKSIWLITSRLIWILLAHKNTFYSLHVT